MDEDTGSGERDESGVDDGSSDDTDTADAIPKVVWLGEPEPDLTRKWTALWIFVGVVALLCIGGPLLVPRLLTTPEPASVDVTPVAGADVTGDLGVLARYLAGDDSAAEEAAEIQEQVTTVEHDGNTQHLLQSSDGTCWMIEERDSQITAPRRVNDERCS